VLKTTCNFRCHSVLAFGWCFRFIGSFPNASDLADLWIAFLLPTEAQLQDPLELKKLETRLKQAVYRMPMDSSVHMGHSDLLRRGRVGRVTQIDP